LGWAGNDPERLGAETEEDFILLGRSKESLSACSIAFRVTQTIFPLSEMMGTAISLDLEGNGNVIPFLPLLVSVGCGELAVVSWGSVAGTCGAEPLDSSQDGELVSMLPGKIELSVAMSRL
jgi:hypothetical protein